MERETGTESPDLPHEFVERDPETASSANPVCALCRQGRSAVIHQVETEQASSEPTIPRERGS